MIKKYKIMHFDTHWDCEVEINPEFIIEDLSEPDQPYTTMKAMEEMVKFWMGWEGRLDSNDGDIIKTFLQSLGREIQYILYEHEYNVIGVINEFKEREGWFDMDGRYGIKILSTDDLSISHEEFHIEEA